LLEVNHPTDIGVHPDDKHLSTDHLLGDLKGHAIYGTVVTIAAQGAQFILTLVSTMVLARLLGPKDFGLYAMVTAVMGYLIVFKDAGLSTSTIQHEGITHAQVSNLFWINVALGGAITLALAAVAPIVAWFYGEPRLVAVTLALSITFLLNALTIQHTALLRRQMRFKAVGLIQVGSMLCGVTVGIGMAVFGYGYWSLVAANFVTVAITVPLTWLAMPWRPIAPSRCSGTGSLVSFGANVATGGFIYSIARGADMILVGRFCGSGALGLYSRAAVLLSRPMDQFLGPFNAVFLPVLSRLQADPRRYRRTFLRVYEAIALVSFLWTGVLFALARPVTLVVLGPKWDQAAIIFAGFTAGASVVPMATAASWLFASQGRGPEWLINSSIVSAIIFASFVAGLPFGPAGVAIVSSGISLLIGMPTLYYFAGRRGPVRTSDLWMGIFRYLPVWLISCGAAYGMRLFLLTFAPLPQLFLAGTVGLLAGLALISSVPSMRQTAVSLFVIARELKSWFSLSTG
jgi:O-antigen/teichoic acid export membrane protein